MTRIRKSVLSRLGAGAMGALVVTGFLSVVPASAVTTTICLDTSINGTKGSGSLTCNTGGKYGKEISTSDTTGGTIDAFINNGVVTFSSGFVTVKCMTGTSDGASNSDGTGLGFTAFNFTNCKDQNMLNVTVAAHSLTSWSGSSVYNSGQSGKDGTMTINGPSGTYMWSLTDSGTTCNYSAGSGGASGGGSISGDLWDVNNPSTNPQNPFGNTSGKGGVNFVNASFSLFSGGILCSSTGTMTGGFDLTGDTPAGTNIGITG